MRKSVVDRRDEQTSTTKLCIYSASAALLIQMILLTAARRIPLIPKDMSQTKVELK